MSTMDEKKKSPKVGKLRPTQVVTQHGPGAIVDLPELSVIVASIDSWYPTGADRVSEPRLEAFLKVDHLYRPPLPGAGSFGGVPSWVFPDWLVCPMPKCRRLAPSGEFTWVGGNVHEFRCPRNDRHGDRKQVPVFPARFMVACPTGHLDDFPWRAWVHGPGGPCGGDLRLEDHGRSGSANDIVVKCEGCDDSKPLGTVFKEGALAAQVGPGCTGRRPWFGPHDREDCTEQARVILRGASNAYFSVVASALSIPPYSDPIQEAVSPYVEVIRKVQSFEKFEQALELELLDLGSLPQEYTAKQLWAAVHDEVVVERLRPDEYSAFLDPPDPAQPPNQFEVRHVSTPPGPEGAKLGVVGAATRLREVRALRGFTRIESGFDVGELADVAELDIKVAKIGPNNLGWLPAAELRGEGIFVTLDPDALAQWESKPNVSARGTELATMFDAYQADREKDEDERRPFPGMRYVLVHSLAHALIRQLCLEAGYSSSALRERLYCETGENDMAGFLIYTASSDSEGSLGGLVDQAVPDRFGPVLMDALREVALCPQDPLCGAGELAHSGHLNGAACHACLILAETSCEGGNRFLDRSTLVETIGHHDRWFFRDT